MKKKDLLDSVTNIALLLCIVAASYLYIRGPLPEVPGPVVGETLEVEGITGPTTVAMFTTTCSWCAKSWPRWKAMSNLQLVSLDSPEATQAYLDAQGIDLPVLYARIPTPVPVEFDVDTNLVIRDKRLGYQGETQ